LLLMKTLRQCFKSKIPNRSSGTEYIRGTRGLLFLSATILIATFGTNVAHAQTIREFSVNEIEQLGNAMYEQDVRAAMADPSPQPRTPV